MRTITPVILSLVFFAAQSCTKSKQSPFGTRPFIPIDVIGMMPTKAVNAYVFGSPLIGYDGVFTACRVVGHGLDTSGHERTYNGSWESATIVASTPSMVSNSLIDRILVNDTDMGIAQYVNDASSWWYVHKDRSPVLNEGVAIKWAAADNINIPQFNMSVPGVYPTFSGTLPDSISIKKEFLFVFNAADMGNTDSAFVLLYNNGLLLGSKRIKGDGFATISKPAIASFSGKDTIVNTPTNAPGGIIFRGNGYMVVVLFKTGEKKIGNKRYAFVQQSIFFKPVQFY